MDGLDVLTLAGTDVDVARRSYLEVAPQAADELAAGTRQFPRSAALGGAS